MTSAPFLEPSRSAKALGVLGLALALSLLSAATPDESLARQAELASRSPCVTDVPGAFTRLPASGKVNAFRATEAFPPGAGGFADSSIWGMLRHFQGAARIQDTGIFVISGNAAAGSFLHVFEGSSLKRSIHLSRQKHHPGGIQSVGPVLAVGTDSGSNTASEIRFFDFSKTPEPVELSHLRIERARERAETVAFARLDASPGSSSPSHLLIVGAKQTRQLTFYLARGAELSDVKLRFQEIATWRPGPGQPAFPNFQSLQLVTQCDGQIYVLGANRTGVVAGANRIVLLKLDGDALLKQGKAKFTRVADRAIACVTCTLEAGSGIYVDPAADQLKLYATDFWPTQVSSQSERMVSIEEF